MNLLSKNIIICLTLSNLNNQAFFQYKPMMNNRIDQISMSFQVEANPDELIIRYSVINPTDKDIYLTDVILNYQNDKPQVNINEISCSWLKSNNLLLISNYCMPVPEGMLMMNEPSFYVTRIIARSTYSNHITLKIPVPAADMPSGLFKTRTAKGIKLEFGYSFYDESLELMPAEELDASIFIAGYSFLDLQQILSAEQTDLSIQCQKM